MATAHDKKSENWRWHSLLMLTYTIIFRFTKEAILTHYWALQSSGLCHLKLKKKFESKWVLVHHNFFDWNFFYMFKKSANMRSEIPQQSVSMPENSAAYWASCWQRMTDQIWSCLLTWLNHSTLLIGSLHAKDKTFQWTIETGTHTCPQWICRCNTDRHSNTSTLAATTPMSGT